MKTWMKTGILLLAMLLFAVGAAAESTGAQPPKNVLLVKTAENESMSALTQPVDVPGIGTVTVLRCDQLPRGEESTPIRLSFTVFNTTTSNTDYGAKSITAANLVYANNASFAGKIRQCASREKLDVYDHLTSWGDPVTEGVPVLQIGYYYIQYDVPNAVIDLPGSIVPGFTIGDTTFSYGYREYNETDELAMTEGMLVITNPATTFAPAALNTPIDIPRVGQLTILKCEVGSKGSETTPVYLSFMITNTTEGEKNYRDNVIRRRHLMFANVYDFSGKTYQCRDREALSTYDHLESFGDPVSDSIPVLQNGYFYIRFDVANAVFEMPGSINISFYLSDTQVTYCFRQ